MPEQVAIENALKSYWEGIDTALRTVLSLCPQERHSPRSGPAAHVTRQAACLSSTARLLLAKGHVILPGHRCSQLLVLAQVAQER